MATDSDSTHAVSQLNLEIKRLKTELATSLEKNVALVAHHDWAEWKISASQNSEQHLQHQSRDFERVTKKRKVEIDHLRKNNEALCRLLVDTTTAPTHVRRLQNQGDDLTFVYVQSCYADIFKELRRLLDNDEDMQSLYGKDVQHAIETLSADQLEESVRLAFERHMVTITATFAYKCRLVAPWCLDGRDTDLWFYKTAGRVVQSDEGIRVVVRSVCTMLKKYMSNPRVVDDQIGEVELLRAHAKASWDTIQRMTKRGDTLLNDAIK